MPYHHGNVRAAMLEAAVEAIRERGATAVSLRDLARRVGVSHTAASHHFGDKTGLMTAVAIQGFELLAEMLNDVFFEERDFAKVGVAYVRFSVEHPAHFEVMFRPELYRTDDEELIAARILAATPLFAGADRVADAAAGDSRRAGVAAWSFVHGIAILWRDGNLKGLVDDPVALTAEVTPLLFQASKASKLRKRG